MGSLFMIRAMSPPSNKPDKSQDVSRLGELLLVATPIGNLGDITLRALETLKSVQLIACEDTRTTAKLLTHYGIHTRTVSYHDHNEASASAPLVARMQAGERIALVSDAGTPLLSDPGARLVAAAIEAGIRITPLPGASALLAALTMAGLPAEQFYYAGFLPIKTKAQQAVLHPLRTLQSTLVFYEAPHRLVDTLAALQETFGDRPCAVARELTKLYEECQRGTLSQVHAHYVAHPPRGECVILLHGAAPLEAMDDAAIDAALLDALSRGSVKQAVEEVTSASGWPKREVYQRALQLKS